MRAFRVDANEKVKQTFETTYEEACLWASSEVINAVNDLLKIQKSGETKQEKLERGYSACIEAMRKDCGEESSNFEYQIFKFK